MRQIVLNLDDEAFEPVMGVLKLSDKVEIVCETDVADSRKMVDTCMARAVRELQEREVIKHSSDHTFIMLLANQGLVDKHLFFSTPLDYIKYLKEIGVEDIPSKTRLYLMQSYTRNQYPEWTFADCQDAGERLRRNNVARQFLSAYIRHRIAIAERYAEK